MQRRRLLLSIPAVLAGCGHATAPAVLPADTQLVDLQTRPATLEQWRGRLLLINVWASWCAPCRAEMAALQALSERLDRRRADLIGLTVDEDTHLAREYLLRVGVTFRNFVDGPARVSRTLLGVRSLPETLLIDGDGAIRQRLSGARDWHDPALLHRHRIPLAGASASGLAFA